MLIVANGRLTMIAEIQNFDARLQRLIRYKNMPALSVAVVSDAEIDFAKGYGFSNLATGTSAAPDTPYIVGSITKPLAATLLMSLAETHGLDFDAPMRDYYKSYATFCKRVQSFAKSGLEPRELFQNYRCADFDISLRHHLSHTSQGKPGTKFLYNSFLYGVSSRVVDSVAQCDYSLYFEEHIIKALGLSHTSPHTCGIPMRQLPKPVASVYYVDNEGKSRPSDYPEATFNASAGLISSVLDLAAFDMALDTGRLISEEGRDAMWTAYPLKNNGEAPYGLGWYLQDYGDLRLVWHSAWWPDAASAIYLKIPEKRLSLIMLANTQALWWDNPLNMSDILPSPFVQSFLNSFVA
jgi:CubicO group peptidase (beta-lactamase class C family)